MPSAKSRLEDIRERMYDVMREGAGIIRDVENSRFTKVTLEEGAIQMDTETVNFTRVKPGETLIEE
jgi:hypothetical protein